MLRYVLNQTLIENEWSFARCREVQKNPDGYLDLWARGHYKSTIITFGKTIQDVLNYPEKTIGIFSNTRPLAIQFLRQIKTEFETNESLKTLFPDILYENPQSQAPKWTEHDGIVVKRKGNPKESTIEAWGLIEGMPTGKHFDIRIYDDLITETTVNTPEMINKAIRAWELSNNLGKEGGIERYIGTRYHLFDPYSSMMDRKVVKVREYPATVDGKFDGEPVLFTKEMLKEKRDKQGPYVFSCQMLLNPVAEEVQGFKAEWLRYYNEHNDGKGMNVYMVVDPASEKRKSNDYTAIWVIGTGGDRNYYALDIIRDRLSLTQRADIVMELHKKWDPIAVGYEKYGMMADIEYIKERQERENHRFDIIELGGQMPKKDRIRRLVPLFEKARVFLPKSLHKGNYEGIDVDLVQTFIKEELLSFPVSKHDDMLDALSRIVEEKMGVQFPNDQWGTELKYDDAWIV